MPRVLHVINDLDHGGAQTQLRLLVGAAGEDARVASLRRPGATATSLGSQADWLQQRFTPDPFAVRNLLRLARRQRPDVLQSWDAPSARLCGVVRRLHGVPWVHTLRGKPLRKPLKADGYLVTDEAAAERAVAAGVNRAVIAIVPNAIDPAILSNLKNDKLAARARLRSAGVDLADDAPVLVAVARMDDPAAVRELAWTADLVRIVCPGLRFLIAGDGPGRMACERFSAKATERGLNVFLGRWNDLGTLYAAADAAWCGAGWGGAPTPAIEAMAAGLPLVIANAPGRERLLPAEAEAASCRLRWDDRAAWARVTKRLLTDRLLADTLGPANAERSQERHLLGVVEEAHRAAMSGLLAGRAELRS